MQRWRAISNPSDTWGPALKQHRLEAAEVHKRHGTTMGGSLKYGSGPEPSVAYIASNAGYDHPL